MCATVPKPSAFLVPQRKLEQLRAAVRGEEKRVSELEQSAKTTSNQADIAQVHPLLHWTLPLEWCFQVSLAVSAKPHLHCMEH